VIAEAAERLIAVTAELADTMLELERRQSALALELERMRAWVRAIAALAGPEAIGVAERAIAAASAWPAGYTDGHGARRGGG
jgi:hypothetical protein